MTITLNLTDLLLLAPVPLLLLFAVYGIAGLVKEVFNGNGGFRLALTPLWLVLVTPTVIAGLVGIYRAVFA